MENNAARVASVVLFAGAVVGNMALVFGLLSRPRNVAALSIGMAAYFIATLAWLVRRRSLGDGP